MTKTMIKPSGVIKKIKKVAISIGIFLASYIVFYLSFDAIALVKEPIGQAEFTQTSSDLEKIKSEDEGFTIDDVKAEKEKELKKLESTRDAKTQEIERLKKDIESIKKSL